jgi:putative membrane protein
MKWRTYALYFLILVYVSGSIGFAYNPSFFLPFTPFTLLFTCFVFLCYQPLKNKTFILAFAGIALIGFISEVIGVKTGLVFGNYYYGNTLGIKLLGVPLTISINWALLATASILVSTYVFKNKWMIAASSSFIATSIDFLIEQLAPRLDFWYFSGGMAGVHNYIGWFLVSFAAALLFQTYLKGGDKKISLIILGLQLLFFGIIYFINFKI